MSQWAEITDRLNQWAESRRQFMGVHACVRFDGEAGGDQRRSHRDDVLRFLGGLLQVGKPVLQMDVCQHKLKITVYPN